MNILLYCSYANSEDWKKAIINKFRGENVYTLSDNPELKKAKKIGLKIYSYPEFLF